MRAPAATLTANDFGLADGHGNEEEEDALDGKRTARLSRW